MRGEKDCVGPQVRYASIQGGQDALLGVGKAPTSVIGRVWVFVGGNYLNTWLCLQVECNVRSGVLVSFWTIRQGTSLRRQARALLTSRFHRLGDSVDDWRIDSLVEHGNTGDLRAIAYCGGVRMPRRLGRTQTRPPLRHGVRMEELRPGKTPADKSRYHAGRPSVGVSVRGASPTEYGRISQRTCNSVMRDVIVSITQRQSTPTTDSRLMSRGRLEFR